MSDGRNEAEITLVEAAVLLKRDYQWARARAITGQLDARQVYGRWVVTAESARCLAEQRIEQQQRGRRPNGIVES